MTAVHGGSLSKRSRMLRTLPFWPDEAAWVFGIREYGEMIEAAIKGGFGEWPVALGGRDPVLGEEIRSLTTLDSEQGPKQPRLHEELYVISKDLSSFTVGKYNWQHSGLAKSSLHAPVSSYLLFASGDHFDPPNFCKDYGFLRFIS